MVFSKHLKCVAGFKTNNTKLLIIKVFNLHFFFCNKKKEKENDSFCAVQYKTILSFSFLQIMRLKGSRQIKRRQKKYIRKKDEVGNSRITWHKIEEIMKKDNDDDDDN